MTIRTRTCQRLAGGIVPLLLALTSVVWAQAPQPAKGDAKRGEYLSKAGGCLGCHTEEKQGAVAYAGGRALKTPFGTFYGPNITPHPDAGIGKWSEANFFRAMREGKRPDGANYFPAFPYPSFTAINDTDLRDLFAYLKSLPANAQPSRAHELRFPFNVRFGVTFWKMLYFKPGAFIPDAKLSEQLNRGNYLTNALGHCGECHTPRNFMGGPRKDRFLAGGMGPEGKEIPNLTPARLKKKWGDKDLTDFLASGLTPDGDEPSAAMREVITNTTGHLTPADLAAMIAYLRSLPPIEDEKK
ncbi:MAG: c-type cytochrome [Betaproteobacteria bacterium]|nr:c-type cytochrome [Betaproteobacteria bacterium]